MCKLNLKKLTIAGYGVDDNQQIAYVTAPFALSNSGYYDSNLECLILFEKGASFLARCAFTAG